MPFLIPRHTTEIDGIVLDTNIDFLSYEWL